MDFANKADEEGYGQVASLFRMAVKSEAVHIRNYVDLITKIKAVPKPVPIQAKAFVFFIGYQD